MQNIFLAVKHGVFTILFLISIPFVVFVIKTGLNDINMVSNQRRRYLKRAQAVERQLLQCRADKKPIGHYNRLKGQLVLDPPKELQQIAFFGTDFEFEVMIVENVYPKVYGIRRERLNNSPFKRKILQLRKMDDVVLNTEQTSVTHA